MGREEAIREDYIWRDVPIKEDESEKAEIVRNLLTNIHNNSIEECFNNFDKQLKANQDQIRKAQNIISEERIKNDKIMDAVARGGFELKEIKGEFVLCKI